MQSHVTKPTAYATFLIIFCFAVAGNAYDLTQAIQHDLVALGYEPGNVDGEASIQTIVAIAQFEAERGLEVKGEITPQLAGILAAEVAKQSGQSVAQPTTQPEEASSSSAPVAAGAAIQPEPVAMEIAASTEAGAAESATAETPVAVDEPDESPDVPPEEAIDPEALKAAQTSCIQEKVAEAQAAEKKRSGFGSLMSAVGRTAGQFGSDDVANTAGGLYDASATAADLSKAAEDLGLTEDDIAECENPPM